MNATMKRRIQHKLATYCRDNGLSIDPGSLKAFAYDQPDAYSEILRAATQSDEPAGHAVKSLLRYCRPGAERPVKYLRQTELEAEPQPEPVKPVEAPPAEPVEVVVNVQFDAEQFAREVAARIKIVPPAPAEYDIEPVRDDEGKVVLYRRVPKRPRR